MASDEEFPDAVVFIQSLEPEFPDVTSLLTTDQLKALDLDPKYVWLRCCRVFEIYSLHTNCAFFCSTPLDGDDVNETFVRLADSYFTAKMGAEGAQSSLRTELSEARAKGKEASPECAFYYLACIAKHGRLLSWLIIRCIDWCLEAEGCGFRTEEGCRSPAATVD